MKRERDVEDLRTRLQDVEAKLRDYQDPEFHERMRLIYGVVAFILETPNDPEALHFHKTLEAMERTARKLTRTE